MHMAPAIPIEYTGHKEYRNCSSSQLMGKSRKYSKGGNSSGFVPDYRHVVETMAQSEGLGISAQIDAEMTTSQDSCAPKRKCISLNADSYDNFCVPTQVLSLSKMSRPERKDVVLTLKLELEQVQVLQKKVSSLGSRALLSPSTGNRSSNDGKKRPLPENFHQSAEVLSSHGKKGPFGGRNGARTKKSTSKRLEPVKPIVAVSNSNAHLMKQCDTLLDRMLQHNAAWPFKEPVDVVKMNIPDYLKIIKHPMDLGTVKNKMAAGQYSSSMDFAADVRLAFSNAMTYNPPGNYFHNMAKALSKFFEGRWKAIEKKLPVAMDLDPMPSTAAASIEVEGNSVILPFKKKKINPKETMIESQPVRQIMTDQEKHNLSTELEALLGELPETIVEFLREQSTEGQTGDEEIEIDIDALSDETLFKLRKLLDDYLLEKQKNQAKAEPCELELHNESGVSNSSMQPCKGNDQVDEDIDLVGGNDPLTSSYPAVEIEKDLTHRNSRCSSPSSSSSEPGSSSGDSDSDNESDAGKASIPVSSMKKKSDSGTKVGLQNDSIAIPDDENQSLNELGPVELNSHDKPSACEAEDQQEEESAPAERHVSPEKLYRAALLRNRFADTILKAREKALEKGEKGDPEKLRMEREEKARLQAEAKAAEEARRKAEAEAAAEAKRKRELEREAARQALLKMEKTVDINENSQFMEDFEMLRTSNNEQLPNFMESSPGLSQKGLGCFKLQGNPLEQLGLYMKADEEDEEDEPPPHSTPEPVNDVEEGEID